MGGVLGLDGQTTEGGDRSRKVSYSSPIIPSHAVTPKCCGPIRNAFEVMTLLLQHHCFVLTLKYCDVPLVAGNKA